MKVFSGTIGYTNRQCAFWRSQGYVVVKRNTWSDGKVTVKMEKKDETKT